MRTLSLCCLLHLKITEQFNLNLVLRFFFSAVRTFSQNLGSPNTQHRLYSHNTFFPLDESNPRAKQIKPSTALTVSYNLLHPGSSTSLPLQYVYSLLSFTHYLASGLVSPLTLKQPFIPSNQLYLGLPLSLLPSSSARFIFFTNFSSSILSICQKSPQDCCFPLFTQASLKPTSSPKLFIPHSISPCHTTHTPQT